jgi:hypothetical protein
MAEFRIRIGSGFYQVRRYVSRSGIRIRDNKNDQKKEKLRNFMSEVLDVLFEDRRLLQ